MKNLFKVSALMLGLGLGVSQGANAALTHLGTVGTDGGVYYSDTIAAGQSFNDAFQFDVAGISDIGATVTATYSVPSIDFTTFDAQLYDLTTSKVIADLGAVDNVDTSTWDGSFNLSALPKHSYEILVSGVAGSSAEGGFASYSGTIAVSPVPEAEEWAMMMLGMGVITAQLRRKSQKTTTTTIVA